MTTNLKKAATLLELLIGLGIAAFLVSMAGSFLVNAFQDTKFVQATAEMSNVSRLLVAEMEKNFLYHRSDEAKQIPNPCIKPSLNFLRLDNDSPPNNQTCNGYSNTYFRTPVLDVAPENATAADQKELRGSKMVLEKVHDDDSVSRIEYKTVCSEQAPLDHFYRKVNHDWGKVFSELESAGCLPEMNESPQTCGSRASDNNNDWRSFAIIKTSWIKKWDDRLDNYGDNANNKPTPIPTPTSIKCLPTTFFEYDPILKSCKFRDHGDAKLAGEAYGMSFCSWSKDISQGSELQLRFFTFIDLHERKKLSNSSQKNFNVRVTRFDQAFNRDIESEFVAP